MGSSGSSGSTEQRIAALGEDYLARLNAGEQPDRERLLGDNADISVALARRLDLLDLQYRRRKDVTRHVGGLRGKP